MLFNTFEFAAFCICVLAIYYILSRRAQNILLIAASYFFYSWWDWRFAGLLIAVTLINYFGTRSFSCSVRRKTYFWLCIGSNLLILGFFKYYNFFADSLAALLRQFDIVPPLPALSIILPIGISFYTFQSIGFVVDVYKGKASPPRSFITVAAFTAFFPQLLAGPIERAEHMLPQYHRKRSVNNQLIAQGLLLIFIGLFKKIAIADVIAQEVNTVFSSIATTPWPELIGGLWYFTIQLYCDFSGYSDMARGIAFLLGFKLMINFNQPFLATNIADYWRRWHISLSTWLRDYLYIPLGGSKMGPSKTIINILITMLLCGLWHGANWTFVIWGLINGIYLAAYRALSRTWFFAPRNSTSKIWRAIRFLSSTFFLFNLLLIPWLFFRADSVADALAYLYGIISLQGEFSLHGFYFCKLAFFVTLVMLLDIPQYISRDHTVFLKWHWLIQGLVYGTMLIIIILLAPQNEMPFIYFQF